MISDYTSRDGGLLGISFPSRRLPNQETHFLVDVGTPVEARTSNHWTLPKDEEGFGFWEQYPVGRCRETKYSIPSRSTKAVRATTVSTNCCIMYQDFCQAVLPSWSPGNERQKACKRDHRSG
jgi:hypothetical protein